jgi:beta-phosphoglucomutase-like phosphatase (HAD superfamily)
MPRAVFFDIDGTLIDSVDLHASAWHKPFLMFGHDVSFEQARSQIGKGAAQAGPGISLKCSTKKTWRRTQRLAWQIFQIEIYAAGPSHFLVGLNC